MEGKLFIDGFDAYVHFGIFVDDDGLKQVIQMPAFKSLDSTNWPDEDGEDVDLSAPVLNARTIQLQLSVKNVRFAEDFFYMLSDGAYHDWQFADLGKTYTLRMTQNGSFQQYSRLGKFTITLADDSPIVPSGEPYALAASPVRQAGYSIDGIEFAQFGAFVLEGTDANIRKCATLKSNLTTASKYSAGQKYDGEVTYYKQKDAQIKLLINAPTIAEFWKRYNALYAQILGAGMHTLRFASLGAEYQCYYKTSAVSKMKILCTGRAWCEFSITLTIQSCRPIDTSTLLGAEVLDYIIAEDGSKIVVYPRSEISYTINNNGDIVPASNK